MIIRKTFKKQYGMGFKYYQTGDGVFDSVKKYGFPVLKYLFRFVRNNLPEILQISKNIINKHDQKPTFTQVVDDIKSDPHLEKIKEKSLTEHFRGGGLSKKSKKILKELLGGGLKILK